MSKSILTLCLCFALILACKKDEIEENPNTTQDCSTAAKAFAANVAPLIASSCTSSLCHGSGTNNGVGPLTDYTKIFAARNLIKSAISNGSMPKNSSLTTAQKNTIICWIDSGAANN